MSLQESCHSSLVKGHRTFIIISLALAAVAGTLLGMWMILGWLGYVSLAHFSDVLRIHGQLQVYGFVVLFTMGVAMMVLPRFLGTTLRPPDLVAATLALMVAGIVANFTGPSVLGAALQTASVVTFTMVIRATRRSAPPRSGPSDALQKAHALFLATGGLWLFLSPGLAFVDPTRALENVLWGFAGLYIAGIGLRVHPQVLALAHLRPSLFLPSCLMWNAALATRWLMAGPAWTILMVAAVTTFLLALNPFQRSTEPMEAGAWIRLFVRTSYFWLIAATALALLTEVEPGSYVGPARHSLASGYILTMMVGMGFRMIPTFESKRLVWVDGPWVAYGALTLGGILRVGGQAVGNYPVMGIGGGLQVVSVLLFVGVILGTLAVGVPVPMTLPARAARR